MATADTILELINSTGPVLPVHVAKKIGSNILMASAHLSELISRKKLKVSKIKVGGSPLYLIPGQEAQLENFSDNLNDKEKEAFELLKQKKVLKDSAVEPAHRLALRTLKDFAFPLDVKYNNTKELFWKWHTASDEDVTNIVRELITPPKPKLEPKPEVKIEPPKVQKQEVQKQIPIQKEAIKEKSSITKPKLEKKTEQQIEKKITKPEPKNIEKETVSEISQDPKGLQEDVTSPFIKELNNYFSKNNIEVVERNIIRKGSELEFIVKVPSNVGALTYFCKAKAKKRINDGDLGSAFIQGQMKKLPVLLLTKGSLSKKAQEMLDNELKGMTLANL